MIAIAAVAIVVVKGAGGIGREGWGRRLRLVAVVVVDRKTGEGRRRRLLTWGPICYGGVVVTGSLLMKALLCSAL